MSGKGAPASLSLLTVGVEIADQRKRTEVNMRGIPSLLSLQGGNVHLLSKASSHLADLLCRCRYCWRTEILQQDGFGVLCADPSCALSLLLELD